MNTPLPPPSLNGLITAGEVPEANPFAFAPMTFDNYSMTWDDAPEFGTAVLDGNIDIDALGHMNGSVSVVYDSGFHADVTYTSQATPNLFVSSSIDGSTVLEQVESGNLLLNGSYYSWDQLSEDLGNEIPALGEAQWSDRVHLVVAVMKVMSTAEFGYNVRVAQRTSVLTFGVGPCAAWVNMIVGGVGTAVSQAVDKLVEEVQRRDGKFFCSTDVTGKTHYWVDIDPKWFNKVVINAVLAFTMTLFREWLMGMWISE